MKQASLFVLALAIAVPACGKHNEVDVLQHEATAAAKHYAPKVEALEARLNAIVKRGETITAGSAPGVQDVGARLKEARDLIIQLQGIVKPQADGKSAVEKQAAEAAKGRRVDELEKLVHDTHAALDRGMTVINADLSTAESWLAYYDQRALALPPHAGMPTPMPMPDPGAPGAAPAPGGAAPAAPGGVPAAPAGEPAHGGPGAAAPTAPTHP